jgi:hypothetical protein
MAALVSPELVVTREPPRPRETLTLSFPDSPDGVQVAARRRFWDGEAGVAVLELERPRKGLERVPLVADPPAPGSTWVSLWLLPDGAAVRSIGTVLGLLTEVGLALLRLRTDQDAPPAGGLAGAPVLVEDRLAGIVAGTAAGTADLLALPISAIAKAGGGTGAVIDGLLASAAGTTVSGDELDEALFARLDDASRRALGDADGIRQARRLDKLHMEHLVFGLYRQDGPTRRAFVAAGIDERKLREVIAAAVRAPIPDSWKATAPSAFPPMSSHARQAVIAARDTANEAGSAKVRTGNLLQGAFSVADCTVIAALREAGAAPEPLRRASTVSDIPSPADETTFVGRGAELASVVSILRRAGTPGLDRPPVVVVSGQRGIGKTSLANIAAERVRDHFPDGIIRLSALEIRRWEPGDAVREVLARLGAEPVDAPGDLNQLTRTYRRATTGETDPRGRR